MTGNQVRAARESTDLTVAQLSEILGVRNSSVYRWEAGGNKKSRIEGLPHTLLKLIAAFSEKDAKEVGRAFRAKGSLYSLLKIVDIAYKNA